MAFGFEIIEQVQRKVAIVFYQENIHHRFSDYNNSAKLGKNKFLLHKSDRLLGYRRRNTPFDHRNLYGIVHDQARHHRIGENR